MIFSYLGGRGREDHDLRPARAKVKCEILFEKRTKSKTELWHISKKWSTCLAIIKGPEFNPQYCQKIKIN
jgi:hypothetical protein